MLSTAVWRGHEVHFVVFGLPILALVSAVGWQEARARWGAASHRSGHEEDLTHPTGVLPDLTADALRFAATGLGIAAVLHAAVITEHFRESVLYGVFFTALAIAQCWLAVMLLRRPNRRMVLWIALGSAWVIVLWLVTRTTGIPIGPEPWEAEPFGALDIASSAAELATVIGCGAYLWMISARSHRHRRHATELAR